MKLNLAALPKEEAWRIWLAAYARGGCSTTLSSAKTLTKAALGHTDQDEEAIEAMGVLSEPLLDHADTICRKSFERWWAEQVQG